ncbi:MAG: GNAT family N-acetyltransferase [Anaerolineales bacterium]
MSHLFGKRIRLRAVEKEDLSLFVRWINDPQVTEDLLFSAPMSRVDEEKWFEAMINTPLSEHVLVIEVQDPKIKGNFLTIGTCQFHNIDSRNRSAEVGIMIGEKSFWDQGYGTETMQLLLKHGFNTLNFHRIWLQVIAKNKRGIHAYQKAGFQYEGKYRQSHYQHGQYFDIHLMSILKDEWQAMATLDEQPQKGGKP